VTRALAAVAEGDGSVDSLLAGLAARGYLDLSLCRDSLGTWRAVGGPRIASLRLRIDAPEHSATTPGTLAVTAAEDLAGAFESAIGGLLAEQDEAGFPLAQIRLTDYAVDSLLTVHLRLDPGPAVRVTDLRFAGQKTSRPGFLRRVARWRGAEAYDAAHWRAARTHLVATGLFESVEGPLLLLPTPAAPAAAAETLACALLFRVRERPASHVSGLLGYSNRPASAGGEAVGLTGFLDVHLANLLGTGRAMRLYWQGWGPERSTFLFSWREPFLWRLPLALEGALEHVQEDTLYAETQWRGELLWNPAPLWSFGIGWGRTRLVLGSGEGRSLSLETTRFRVERGPGEPGGGLGWSLQGRWAQTSGDAPGLRRLEVRLGEWWAAGRWRLEWEQQFGLLAGPDSLLRNDAFLLGGSASLRGSYEGEWRATAFGLQRLSAGPRLGARGGWAYLLLDGGWLREWEAGGTGLRGAPGRRRFAWAAGIGLQTPSRAGRVRLEYAVPGGESLLRGRLHFGVRGAF
jgi:hypothetical protein